MACINCSHTIPLLSENTSIAFIKLPYEMYVKEALSGGPILALRRSTAVQKWLSAVVLVAKLEKNVL